jgi:hypothetical protein
MTVKNIIEGSALWAKVQEPDTKFDPDGTYSISVLVPETEAQEMCEYLDDIVDKAYAEEIKNSPKKKAALSTRKGYDYNYDQEGNQTDLIEFKIKLKAKVNRQDGTSFSQKPIVVDAKRQPLNPDIAVGNGSDVKVAFEPRPYVMNSTKQVGVSLRMKGVQVINLVEYGNSVSSMFDEEDGYVAEASAPVARTPFDDGIATDESEGDF